MVVTTGLALIIGVAVYGLYQAGAALWHRHELEKTIPATLAGVRAQREVLVRAIEDYKERFGYYPPLWTRSGPDRGLVNPLCYELLGAQLDPKSAQFHIPVTKDPLSRDAAQHYFNTGMFSNCLAFPMVPTNFLAGRPLAASSLTPGSELFGVSLSYTDFIPEEFWYDYAFSTWHYLTNPAAHNPGKYDLWVEMKVAGRQITIGNWPEVR